MNDIPKVMGLFAGCGGLDLGFKNAGFEIAYANDKEKSVKLTYEFNLQHEIHIEDFCKVDKTKLLQVDVVIAGVPCQPFSSAGKRESIKNPDGNLFHQVLDTLKSQKRLPKVVVFENVRGFLSSKDENKLPIVERFSLEMKKIGYKTKYQLLNAADYGVPSNRYRVFIVCFLESLKKDFNFPAGKIMERPITVGDILNKKLPKDEEIEIWKLPPSSKQMVPFIKEGGSWKDVPYKYLSDRHKRIHAEMKKYRSPNFYRKFSRKEVMGTITATSSPENSGILHPLEDRRYSVREIARFQSFPDNFKFIGTSIQSKYKMIGNAVPPKLAFEIATAIKSQL
nr:DNA (cytosine-5-)-methyltransferase (TIGR00675) [uncultured Mediterranean phage uvMED]BAR29931.1 DNA (cytosine-5-)-methyltransferase (TIGR00675) [uncultured Mediterranean phage uvMED]